MPDREGEALKLTTADETRLLPGEEPSSRVRGDANHWIDVYSQLRATKVQLIQSLKDLMEGQSPDVQRELERADLNDARTSGRSLRTAAGLLAHPARRPPRRRDLKAEGSRPSRAWVIGRKSPRPTPRTTLA